MEGRMTDEDLATRLRRVIDFVTAMEGRMYCLTEESIATLKEALAALEPVNTDGWFTPEDPTQRLVVPAEPKRCPATVYGRVTREDDGTDTVATYLKCDECGAEFQPNERGVFQYPVTCRKETTVVWDATDYLVDIRNPDQEHRIWIPPGFSHVNVNGERMKVDPKGQVLIIPKRDAAKE
jgi:hypothetical protein